MHTAATVFGIDVHVDTPVPLLGTPSARPTGRTLHMSVLDGDPYWPGTATVLCDERTSGGAVSHRIETHPRAGYLIWGPRYGRHVLSADGGIVRCGAGDGASREWERLLIAQVLPFASLLHGLEVFHASAVVLDGRAIALVGPSGSGKTSVALELCRLGGEFLADDVLALEACGSELLAHPGTPVAGVDRGEVQRLRAGAYGLADTRRFETGVLDDNARELLVAVTGASTPAPLAGLFFLDRQAGNSRRVHFETVEDPRLLLSATFNFVLSSAGRLRGLLDVCALAAARRVERVSVERGTDATLLAEAIAGRVSAHSP
jgi:hypothetical protein